MCASTLTKKNDRSAIPSKCKNISLVKNSTNGNGNAVRKMHVDEEQTTIDSFIRHFGPDIDKSDIAVDFILNSRERI